MKWTIVHHEFKPIDAFGRLLLNSVQSQVKYLVNAAVGLANQPLIKESVKNIAGSLTFGIGLVEIYDICQIMQGRAISTEASRGSSDWIQVAHKVVIVCAKVSLILSAGVSRPGVFIVSSVMGAVFSTNQLDRVFGPNTIFAINPWHPRHLISITAVILALPSVIQSTYIGIHWVGKKILPYQNTPNHDQYVRPWLTDAKVRMLTLFNTVTSRPVLHLGNQLGKLL
jgi:hypothetical protein